MGDGYRLLDEDVLPTRVGMVRCTRSPLTACSRSPHPRGDGPRCIMVCFPGHVFSPPAWGWSGFRCPSHPETGVLPTRVGMVRCFLGTMTPEPSSPHPRGDGPSCGERERWGWWFSPPAWGWSANEIAVALCQVVLPTRVGMVRQSPRSGREAPRSPHPRGDGPAEYQSQWHYRLFSPPAWGWSVNAPGSPVCRAVLPTRVGMVRAANVAPSGEFRSPHPRGDGPVFTTSQVIALRFSPPAWGWSVTEQEKENAMKVLPTRVGMVRARSSCASRPPGSPHPRGDGPGGAGFLVVVDRFSPPAWGWSARRDRRGGRDGVLPTRVGMVRPGARVSLRAVGSPHPRGDGPASVAQAAEIAKFSPPAWGWSGDMESWILRRAVLPTRVGMVREQPTGRSPSPGSPHPRGDGPVITPMASVWMMFSPPAWGWSEQRQQRGGGTVVLPTRVGMVRCSPQRKSSR